ncbi:MAG: hypothetical protein RSB39_07090 [Oscillospiraceae bacterium]
MMVRTIDSAGRILISQRWQKFCVEHKAVIIVEQGEVIITPYDPERCKIEGRLIRKVDDHGRIKISPVIFGAAGLGDESQLHLHIDINNVAHLRRMDEYCDVCGRQTQTKAVLGRRVCDECFDILKRSE